MVDEIDMKGCPLSLSLSPLDWNAKPVNKTLTCSQNMLVESNRSQREFESDSDSDSERERESCLFWEREMDEAEIERAVIAYLKKKGFKQTELAFHQEHQQTKNSSSNSSANSQTDPDIAKHILAFSRSENVPAQYHDRYSKLRLWMYGSLDLYKRELLCVLYPVFIHYFMDLVAKGHIQKARTFFHCFRGDHELMHLRDLQKLEGFLSPSHLEASDTIEYGVNLVGSKVKVWWPGDQMFYEGVIDSFDLVQKKHTVLYTDGDVEILSLREEIWELIGGDSMSDIEQATECQSPDPSPEIGTICGGEEERCIEEERDVSGRLVRIALQTYSRNKKKKAKTNCEPSAKQGKMEGSRCGESSSSVLKGAATKSAGKSWDDDKVDGKSKNNTSKSGGKSEDDSGGTPKPALSQ